MPKVFFATLGCKVNQYETEAMRQMLARQGYASTADESEADLYVVNTCTVTARSDQQARQLIRHLKRLNPQAKLVAVGCGVENPKSGLRELEGVDLALDNTRKMRIADYINGFITGCHPEVSTGFKRPYQDVKLESFGERTRAFVKVEDGCSSFCSYCIIPYVRGFTRSRPLRSIVDEVRGLVEAGYKEVVLTGVQIGDYGDDLKGGTELADVLEAILGEVEGDYRLRLSSIDPADVTERLIGLVARSPKACKHWHLPLQSGDDTLLRKMNRDYTSSDYARLVDRIREAMPGAGINTDLIVGFPGETDESFDRSYEFVRRIGFSRMHIFRFSAREGTPASRRKERVEPEAAKERSDRVAKLARSMMLDFNRAFLGRMLDVLVEEEVDKRTNLPVGFSDNYIRVVIRSAGGMGPGDMEGRIARVRADEAHDDHLVGVFT
jgi:threonylcarbamoyladenosine tRNA methylthiotransferase MtaB